MVDGTMTCKLLAHIPIDATLVRPKLRLLGDRVDDDRLHGRGSHVRNVKMETAHLAATFDERQNWLLRRRSRIGAVLSFPTGKSLVALNEFSFAAKRSKMTLAHCFADA